VVDVSAAAIWAFVGLGVLFVGVLVLVALSVRSLYHSGRGLAEELAGLSEDVERATGEVPSGRDGGPPG
jgi:hypothetical protein